MKNILLNDPVKNQKFFIDGVSSEITIENLEMSTNKDFFAPNILSNYKSTPLGYLTGINYSGNYDAGYFVGKINILEGPKDVVPYRIGETFNQSNLLNPINPLFKQVAGSSDGKYLSVIAGNVFGQTTGNIFNSNNYGKTWNINKNIGAKNWFGIASSADGKYQTAVVFSGNMYMSADYGIHWDTEKILNPSDGYSRFSSVAMSANSKYQTATVYYDRSDIDNEDKYGLYTSKNYGEDWEEMGLYQGIQNQALLWKSCAMNGDGQYQLAVSYAFPPNTGYFYTSNDYGKTWTEKYLPTSASNQRYMAASISNLGKVQVLCTQWVPSDPDKKSIFISNDYGETWNTGVGPTGIAIDGVGGMSDDGSTIGVCAYNGKIYISTNYGVNWAEKSSVKNWTSLFLSADSKYLVGTVYNDPSGIYVSKSPEFIDGDLYADNLYANNLIYNTGNQNISGNIYVNNIYSSGVFTPNLAENYPASLNVRRYVSDSTVTFGTAAPPSGHINYYPFILKKDAINPKICIESVSAGSDTSIKIGIYSGAGFEGAKLGYSGTINVLNSNVPRIERLNTNITLPKGSYIFASCNTGTLTPITFRTVNTNGFLSYFGLATGMRTFLDGGSPAISDFLIYESGSDLKSIIGTGLWNRSVRSPAVCLEY